jgi:cytochrome c5
MSAATLPDGYVVHLPQQAAPRHLFAAAVPVPAERSISGYEQVELRCLTCGATRVTIIPKQGDAWREWREPGALIQSRWPVRCTGVPVGRS